MYSPKISEDLIPIIYRKSKLQEKTMTKLVDEILRSELFEDTDEETKYCCASCRTPVEVVEGVIGYCDYCESAVFIEKI